MNYKNWLNKIEIPSEQELESFLRQAQEAYYGSEIELITDEEYDLLELLLKKLYPNNSLLQETGSDTRTGKIPLIVPMFGLEQLTEDQFDNYIKRHSIITDFIAMQKLDGLSVLLVFENKKLKIAYSRGDGKEGADITRHLKHLVPKNVPNMIVRGEVIISKLVFENIMKIRKEQNKKTYENPRAFVSGQLNSKIAEPEFLQVAELITYQIFNTEKSKEEQLLELKQYFKIPQYFVTKELNSKIFEQYINEYKNTDYETDGLVLWINDTNKFNQLGNYSSNRPYGAFKFKVNLSNEMVTTTVTDVTYRITRYGDLSPRVQVEPVRCNGVTITYATGFNAKYIYDNNIGIGTIVKICRSGDVIPYISEIIKPTFAKMPDIKWSWDKNKVQAIADFNDNFVQEEMKKYQLLNTLVVLGVDMAKEAAVENLSENNITDIFSLLDLSLTQLQNIVGNSAGKTIYDDLRFKLETAEIYQLAAASNCWDKGLGSRKFKKIFEFYKTFDNLTISDIVKVDGFSDKTANIFVNSLVSWNKWISELSNRVKLKEFKMIEKTEIIENEVVVFTGFRDKELEKILENRGWKISSSVSKNTTIIVCDNKNSGSSKLVKAEQLNIPIYEINEFREKYVK